MNYTISEVESVECIGEFQDEYVYDIEMSDNTEHTFFANDILIHNSCYFTIMPALKAKGTQLLKEKNKLSKEAYDLVKEVDKHLNKEINIWAKINLNSVDPRFVFKREVICDAGLFFNAKKRYVLHILDDQGKTKEKFKYTGVEIARSTISSSTKDLIRSIVETAVETRDVAKTNAKITEAYEAYKLLPINEAAFRSGMTDYDKFAENSEALKIAKGTPIHVKSAIYYNELVKAHNIVNKYESITSGMKIKYFYAQKNKLGIPSIAFINDYPKEFDIKIDIDKMFSKTVLVFIKKVYDVIGWRMPNPTLETACDLFELFGVTVE